MKRLGWLLLLLAACVPGDDAIPLGSAAFTLGASPLTTGGVPATVTVDHYAVRFDRIVLGFKTMTVGKVGALDTCSYRGTAQRADVVFDPRRGFTQTFNGIQPVLCPDVGVIFGPPDGATSLGDGVPSSDLVALAVNAPSHAILDLTTTAPSGEAWKVHLRFDTAHTASRFGGCHVGVARGVTIVAGQRDAVMVTFGAENLLREFLADNTADLRGKSFGIADVDADHDVTMAEIDKLPLRALGRNAYQLVDGSQDGTFGDFLRQLFRFTITYGNASGECTGNDPAVPE